MSHTTLHPEEFARKGKHSLARCPQISCLLFKLESKPRHVIQRMRDPQEGKAQGLVNQGQPAAKPRSQQSIYSYRQLPLSSKPALSNMVATGQRARELLEHGHPKLRCAVNAKCIPSFKDWNQKGKNVYISHWIILHLDCMLKCWNDTILDILDQIKCVVYIRFACFFELFYNVATRKFQITHMAHFYGSHHISRKWCLSKPLFSLQFQPTSPWLRGIFGLGGANQEALEGENISKKCLLSW